MLQAYQNLSPCWLDTGGIDLVICVYGSWPQAIQFLALHTAEGQHSAANSQQSALGHLARLTRELGINT